MIKITSLCVLSMNFTISEKEESVPHPHIPNIQNNQNELPAIRSHLFMAIRTEMYVAFPLCCKSLSKYFTFWPRPKDFYKKALKMFLE